MSLRKKIICGILLALVVCFGVAAVWLYDDVSAIFSGVRYSADELEEQLAQNDQTIKDAAQLLPDITIRDLTEEDKQSLKGGTITKEELVDKLISAVVPPESDEPKLPDSTQPGTDQPPSIQDKGSEEPKQYDREIAKIVAETYVLREEFLQRLDELMAQAMADYRALTPAQRKSSKLLTLVSDYLAEGLAMEKECDAQIDEIMVRLEQVLKESGRDRSLADTVFDAYAQEKSLKKSWYMAQLKERGLI